MPAITTVLFALILLITGVATDTTFGEDAPPKFKITTKRDDDRVVVTVEKEATIFDVHSPRGISSATIERTSEAWPDVVLLRLHLTGLESFHATCGKASLDGPHGSILAENPIRLSVEGKKPIPQGPGDPNFLAFQMVDRKGKPTKKRPLKEGYFEMRLPKAFFQENPKAMALKWIDWYR